MTRPSAGPHRPRPAAAALAGCALGALLLAGTAPPPAGATAGTAGAAAATEALPPRPAPAARPTLAPLGATAPVPAGGSPGLLVVAGRAGLAVRAADPAIRLDLMFALRLRHLDLTAQVRAVSTPGRPGYRRYRTVARLAREDGAAPARAAVVRSWLASHGIASRFDVTHSFVEAEPTLAQATALLGTGFRSVSGYGITVITPQAAPRLPAGVQRQLLFFTGVSQVVRDGTVRRPLPRLKATEPQPAPGGTASGCRAALSQRGFSPAEVSTAYGADSLHAAGIEGQGETVGLLELAPVSRASVRVYDSCFGLHRPRISEHLGGAAPPALAARTRRIDALEAAGDAELVSAIAPRLSRIDVFVNDDSGLQGLAEDLSSALDPRVVGGRRPSVLSLSAGFCEPDLSGFTASVALTDHLLAIAALSGVGFVASSGDYGSSACGAGDPFERDLSVSYPASSVFATAVGGTQLQLTSTNAVASETVWNEVPYGLRYASGGGYSVLEPRPWYQAVLGGLPPPGGGRAGRAVPDVSFDASGATPYLMYCASACGSTRANGWRFAFAGTSASAPLFAGSLALDDQLARRLHEAPLGFVDPLLYALGNEDAGVFDGVGGGSNAVFSQHAGFYPAGPGYNLATGWGSVRLAAFAAAALQLAVPRPVAAGALGGPPGGAASSGRALEATLRSPLRPPGQAAGRWLSRTG